jgi:hypothetical protein
MTMTTTLTMATEVCYQCGITFISYCSVVDKDIKPVYTEDVLFPSSSVQKLINYFKNKK